MQKTEVLVGAIIVIIIVVVVGVTVLSVIQAEEVVLYSRDVSLSNTTMTFTLELLKAPEEGLSINRISAQYAYEDFTPTTLYIGDSITFRLEHGGTIKTLPHYITLHGSNRIFDNTWSVDLLIKEDVAHKFFKHPFGSSEE